MSRESATTSLAKRPNEQRVLVDSSFAEVNKHPNNREHDVLIKTAIPSATSKKPAIEKNSKLAHEWSTYRAWSVSIFFELEISELLLAGQSTCRS